MLCSIKELDGFTLLVRDGDFGHAREVHFDDDHWVLRHVVADTGGWLAGRKVLISPHSIRQVDAEQRRLVVALTRRQIENAPGIDTDKPVSRQREVSTYDHYGYPYYWRGPGLWGLDMLPLAGAPLILMPRCDALACREIGEVAVAEREAADPPLHSSADVISCQVVASDGASGHIADFLFDDRSWQIRFAVVDTHNRLPARLVLVPPQWIGSIDSKAHQVRFKVSRDAVMTGPAYERGTLLAAAAERGVQRRYTAWLACAKARDRLVGTE